MPNGYSGSLKRFELRLSLLEVMCLVVCGSEFTRLIIHVFDHFRVLWRGAHPGSDELSVNRQGNNISLPGIGRP